MNLSVFTYLQKLSNRIFPGYALYVQLSAVPQAEKTEQILQILSGFEKQKICRTFVLNNQDVVAFFKNNKMSDMMRVSLKIKGVLEHPLPVKVIDVYTLKRDFEALSKRVSYGEYMDAAKGAPVSVPLPEEGLSLKHMPDILKTIKQANLTPFMHQQNIYSITSFDEYSVIGQTHFITLSEFRQAFFPKINFAQNTVLSHHIMQRLRDRVFEKYPFSFASCSVGFFLSGEGKKLVQQLSAEGTHFIIFDLNDVLLNYDRILPALQKKGNLKFVFDVHEISDVLFLSKLPCSFFRIEAPLILQNSKQLEGVKHKIIAASVRSKQQAVQLLQLHINLFQTGHIESFFVA